MPLQYSPWLPLADMVRLFMGVIILYFIQRMESIKCLDTPSWKPTYIKFFCVAIIILTLISILSPPQFQVSAVSLSIGIPLNIVLIYAVYTYVRELEDSFKECSLSRDDKYVHEFLKFYSLIMVIMLGLVALGICSYTLAFIPFPKYIGAQSYINQMSTKSKSN